MTSTSTLLCCSTMKDFSLRSIWRNVRGNKWLFNYSITSTSLLSSYTIIRPSVRNLKIVSDACLFFKFQLNRPHRVFDHSLCKGAKFLIQSLTILSSSGSKCPFSLQKQSNIKEPLKVSNKSPNSFYLIKVSVFLCKSSKMVSCVTVKH